MEEGGEVEGTDGQHRWIIDPLDGTTNFLHGIPLFAVAIALQRGEEIVASVIYNPVMDELFVAEKGGGAWLNDRKRLRVAGRKHLADAVIATGIKTTGTSNDALQLRQLGHDLAGVCGHPPHRLGLDRSGLAGRRPLRWLLGSRLSPWDVAPGWLMLREAGGTMSDFAGKPGSIWNGEVVAGNEVIQGQLLKIIKGLK